MVLGNQLSHRKGKFGSRIHRLTSLYSSTNLALMANDTSNNDGKDKITKRSKIPYMCRLFVILIVILFIVKIKTSSEMEKMSLFDIDDINGTDKHKIIIPHFTISIVLNDDDNTDVIDNDKVVGEEREKNNNNNNYSVNKLHILINSLLKADYGKKQKIDLIINLKGNISDQSKELLYFLEEMKSRWLSSFDGEIKWKCIKKSYYHLYASSLSWYPKTNNDYLILLDDNMILSSMYFVWIETLIKEYSSVHKTNDNKNKNDEKLIGFDLFETPKILETTMEKFNVRERIQVFNKNLMSSKNIYEKKAREEKEERRGSSFISFFTPKKYKPINFEKYIISNNDLLLLQKPCRSGMVYLPGPWKKMNNYMYHRLKKNIDFKSVDKNVVNDGEGKDLDEETMLKLLDVLDDEYDHNSSNNNNNDDDLLIIPGSKTNNWKPSWRKFFFELIWMEDYFILYPPLDFFSVQDYGSESGGLFATLQKDNHKMLIDRYGYEENIDFSLFKSIKNLILFDIYGDYYENIYSMKIYENANTLKSGEFLGMGGKLESDIDLFSIDEKKCITSVRNASPLKDEIHTFQYIATLLSTGRLKITMVFNNGSAPIVKWISPDIADTEESGIKSSSYDFRLELTSTGSLQIIGAKRSFTNMILAIVGKSFDNGRIFWSSSLIGGNKKQGKYIAKLSSDGLLTIYQGRSEHNFESITWISSSIDSISNGTEILMKREEYIKEKILPSYFSSKLIANYNANIDFMMKEKKQGVTVMINTFARFNTLKKILEEYSQIAVVDRIIVTWADIGRPIPNPVYTNGVIIEFVPQSIDSLNNRFLPSNKISTEAIMITDDDIFIYPGDVVSLYNTWVKFPHNIVGFFPRWIISQNEKSSNRMKSVEYLLGSTENNNIFVGYSIMLTKAMMLHQKFLNVYTNGVDSSYHHLIDTHLNCEDILMNFVVAKDHDGSQPVPLMVQPLQTILDVGHDSKGIHLAHRNFKERKFFRFIKEPKIDPHAQIRSQCLKVFNDGLSKDGQLLLKHQKKIVKAKEISKYDIELQVKTEKVSSRRHRDCVGTKLNILSVQVCNMYDKWMTDASNFPKYSNQWSKIKTE